MRNHFCNLVFYRSLSFSVQASREPGCQRSFQTLNGFTVGHLGKRTPQFLPNIRKPFKIMLIFHASFCVKVLWASAKHPSSALIARFVCQVS